LLKARSPGFCATDRIGKDQLTVDLLECVLLEGKVLSSVETLGYPMSILVVRSFVVFSYSF
jgi:hypothetical protein